jgi:hypothetical protein
MVLVEWLPERAEFDHHVISSSQGFSIALTTTGVFCVFRHDPSRLKATDHLVADTGLPRLTSTAQ